MDAGGGAEDGALRGSPELARSACVCLQNDLGGILVKALMAVATAMTLVGCASVTNDTTHGVRVDTRQKSGAVVAGADCVATNDYGSCVHMAKDDFWTATILARSNELKVPA